MSRIKDKGIRPKWSLTLKTKSCSRMELLRKVAEFTKSVEDKYYT